jgi:indolepyruvate ferredoxin oxidoreductase
MRRLRGTPLDLFGWARVRRLEREMIPEYIAAIESLLPHVSAGTLPEVVAIASLPDRIRGYEHIKCDRAIAYREELSRRLEAFARDSVPSLT